MLTKEPARLLRQGHHRKQSRVSLEIASGGRRSLFVDSHELVDADSRISERSGEKRSLDVTVRGEGDRPVPVLRQHHVGAFTPLRRRGPAELFPEGLCDRVRAADRKVGLPHRLSRKSEAWRR